MIKLFRRYTSKIVALIAVVIGANAIGLAIPRIVGLIIDAVQTQHSVQMLLLALLGVSIVVTLLLVVQNILTARLSEKVAFDIREQAMQSITQQPYTYVGKNSPEELVTRITSDVDAVKQLFAQGLPNVVMALILLVGSAALLLSIHMKLAFAALALMPIMVIAFGTIFGKAGALFGAAQKNLGVINKIISESILGAMVIRVLHSQSWEVEKFNKANAVSRDIGYKIVNLFSSLIPVVTLISNIAVLVILWFGGNWAMQGNVSIGDLSAFLSYFQLMVMPIFILGFISSIIARSKISLGRIMEVIQAGEAVGKAPQGKKKREIIGRIECKNVSLQYGAKTVLNKVSFTIEPGTRTAILGPTGAGKTQILMLLAGLIPPTSGEITIDGIPLAEYDQQSLHDQIGIVFQESIVFQASVLENIQFKSDIDQKAVQKAIQVASLDDVVAALPEGLQTQISERGNNLSGGQKQRLMLARALAMNPKILLLDDFTARVDIHTEKQIQRALEKEYPELTLISITQKIQPIEQFEQVIFVMEGEVLGSGTHQELLKQSMDYAQMYASQQSTDSYEH